MESVRIVFTIVSFVTFAGIVIWAFSKAGRRSATVANADLIADDDRVRNARTGAQQ